MQTVLISGASIAGPTLAYWLEQYGYRPTLVERAPAPRPGGHAIDVRGVALNVLRAMGLLDAARRRRTSMQGVSRLDRNGREVWRSEHMTVTGGSLCNDDIEILRDDLSNLLLGALPAATPILYDNTIAALEELADGVEVTFAGGDSRRFDLVVGADGIGSNVRRLGFGADWNYLQPLGVALAVFSAPNHLDLQDWQLDYQSGSHGCLVYAARDNTELRVCLGLSAALEEIPRDARGQMDLVSKRCVDMDWEVPRLLRAMRTAPDFYLGPIAQVKMPSWSRGRVALVGDAAYCPSPYTGQGTSLALIGAYVLARELAESAGDHIAAYARYEDKLRPFVEINQALVDLSRDERFSEPDFYPQVEAALDRAKNAVTLDGPAA